MAKNDAPDHLPSGQEHTETGVLVPKGILYGLTGFNLVLCALVMLLQPSSVAMWQRGLMLLLIHPVLIPFLFVAGAKMVNRFYGENIQVRNAVSLGMLISVVWMLWKMGASS